MAPASPFPIPQAPAKPEVCDCGCCTDPVSCDCFGTPRTFGWCGCTLDKPCDWHAPKEKK